VVLGVNDVLLDVGSIEDKVSEVSDNEVVVRLVVVVDNLVLAMVGWLPCSKVITTVEVTVEVVEKVLVVKVEEAAYATPDATGIVLVVVASSMFTSNGAALMVLVVLWLLSGVGASVFVAVRVDVVVVIDCTIIWVVMIADAATVVGCGVVVVVLIVVVVAVVVVEFVSAGHGTAMQVPYLLLLMSW